MSPSTKKSPKNRKASKMQDEKLQDKINQPVSKLIERSRLKMILKNLSLLKLLKTSNSRIQEMHSLAKRCWNSMLRVPKILQIDSRDNNVCKIVKQDKEELQEATALKKKPVSKKQFLGKPKGKTSKKWKLKKESERSPAAEPRRRKQTKRKVPKTSKSPGLHTRAQKRKSHVKKPQLSSSRPTIIALPRRT